MKEKLGNIATYINGYPFQPSDWADEGKPIIRIQDLTGTTYQTNRYSGNIDKKYFVKKGDILISWSASLGVYVWEGEDALLNQHIFKVVFNKIEVDKMYFVYQLSSLLKRFAHEAHGATMKHLTKPVFDSIPFSLPSLDEQRQIATIFNKIESLICNRNQQLEKLDLLVKAKFYEMFVKQHFTSMPFGELCLFLRNGANIKQTKNAGGYPITRIETLSNGVFNINRLGYAGITDLKKYQAYILQKGDILISHINSAIYLGRAVQYRGELNTPVLHGMNLLCARLAPSVSPDYIEAFFRTKKARDYISSIAKKAVNQASITSNDLKKMNVPIPPLPLQEQFAHFVEQTEKIKSKIKQSLEKLELLKQSLLQKYFG